MHATADTHLPLPALPSSLPAATLTPAAPPTDFAAFPPPSPARAPATTPSIPPTWFPPAETLLVLMLQLRRGATVWRERPRSERGWLHRRPERQQLLQRHQGRGRGHHPHPQVSRRQAVRLGGGAATSAAATAGAGGAVVAGAAPARSWLLLLLLLLARGGVRARHVRAELTVVAAVAAVVAQVAVLGDVLERAVHIEVLLW